MLSIKLTVYATGSVPLIIGFSINPCLIEFRREQPLLNENGVLPRSVVHRLRAIL